MEKVEQSEIQRGDIVIPGGWTVKVPSNGRLDDAEERAIYVRYLQRQGHGGAVAEKVLRHRMQDLWNSVWCQRVREAVAGWAEEYREIHGSLNGFRPEEVAPKYFPGDRPGRAGKPGVRKLLVQMGEADE